VEIQVDLEKVEDLAFHCYRIVSQVLDLLCKIESFESNIQRLERRQQKNNFSPLG